jgi:hypothetical protein
MERTTKTVTTARGHTAVMYDYMTGLEVETIRNFYTSKAEIKSISQDGTKVEAGVAGMAVDAAMETKKLMLRTAILSIDGHAENVDDAALALPNDDYQEILGAVNELLEGKKK